MKAVFYKELRSFFARGTGLFVIILFSLINGLVLWILRGGLNIPGTGYADMLNFFEWTPWLLLLFIPALTMRSFSEEIRLGTMEILRTLPIRTYGIILGKFAAIVVLMTISILPSLIYVVSIDSLALNGTSDHGSIAGSYIGLLLLSFALSAISIWASSISRSQITAFIIALITGFLLYWGMEQAAYLYPELPEILKNNSLYYHYKSLGRGVIDTRDLVYLLSITGLFLYFTHLHLQADKIKSFKRLTRLLASVALFLLINSISGKIHIRKDLTADRRYTLSAQTLNELAKSDQDIYIKVYLKGDFPLEFNRLAKYVRQHLEELKAYSPRLHFRFVKPAGKEKELIKKGMEPVRLTVEEKNAMTEKIIFPWAEMHTGGKSTVIPLLPASDMQSSDQLQAAMENMEYAFTRALHFLQSNKRKSIAVMRGNGELDNIFLLDFLSAVKEKNNLAEYSLLQAEEHPVKTLKELSAYDMILVAKPTRAFSETQKYILDQYILNGGRSMWLLDYNTADIDSLRSTGRNVVIARDLNLTDMLFAYGVRIHYDIVQDAYAAPIPIATGNINGKPQFTTLPWTYFPLVRTDNEHPVTKGLDPVLLRFPSSMDTLKNPVHKSILLHSSPMTKVTGTPAEVSLDDISHKPDAASFHYGKQIFGVLLEGEFPSAYAYKTKPFSTTTPLSKGKSKMLVVSDGDIVANTLKNGRPTRLDIDPWTGMSYGNKSFLLNAVDDLLDDSDILSLRGKKWKNVVLDKKKLARDLAFWQILNLVFPLLLIGIPALFYTWWRKRKYARAIQLINK